MISSPPSCQRWTVKYPGGIVQCETAGDSSSELECPPPLVSLDLLDLHWDWPSSSYFSSSSSLSSLAEVLSDPPVVVTITIQPPLSLGSLHLITINRFYLLRLYLIVRNFLYGFFKLILWVYPGVRRIEIIKRRGRWCSLLKVMEVKDLGRRLLLVEDILQLVLGGLLFLAH